MGEVYRATDTRLHRDVAIKAAAERFAERFTAEARLIASLNHSNICTLYDVGPNYLVMELVEGPTLAHRIAQGAVPIIEAWPIAEQIADALEAAHEHGIIHRDLKPANIKLRPDDKVKVLDSGFAKELDSGARSGSHSQAPTSPGPAMTRIGEVFGTAAYMSPEQARGSAADKRSDVWAFGCVLYEMLAGRPAFRGSSLAEVLGRVL